MNKTTLSFGMKTLLFCMASIALVVTGQNKTTTTKPPINDSTAIISMRDLQEFNALLKQSASYEQYLKLNPEATLNELWKWKMQQLNPPKKQLSDTTKKK